MTMTSKLWRYADAYAFMEQTVAGLPPIMICVACNGGIQGKESNEALPETADEIAESVQGAYEAGATLVHVHARDRVNRTEPARDAETWWEVNSKIRAACPDIIINNTTGGGLTSTMEERLACLDAKPEIASLNLTPDMSRFKVKERRAPLQNPRPAVDYDDCVPFSYRIVNHFAAEMKKRGIKPELETYHSGGTWVIRDLIEKQLIAPPYFIQTVMGYQTSNLPSVDNVYHLLREFPEETLWLCAGIGQFQLPMTTLATLMGGHVRVGLEDNLYLRRGEKLKSNRQVVERAARIAGELNRRVATPAETRAMLGVPVVPTVY